MALAGVSFFSIGLAEVKADQPDESTTPQRVKLRYGVEYQDLVLGEGPSVKPGQTITAHATGWLENGEKFWSSRDEGRTFDFPLHTGSGGVIPGWVDGIPGMQAGGKRKLWVPAKLGYGRRGFGDSIPPNSNLVFEVELFAIQGSK